MLNMMWAIRIVRKPCAMLRLTKSASSDAPMTISGVAMGTKMSRLPRPRSPAGRHPGHALGAERAGVDEHRDEDRRHEHERQRCRRGVVPNGQELRLDDVPDHVLLRRAEQLRIDEVPRRGDEGEQR